MSRRTGSWEVQIRNVSNALFDRITTCVDWPETTHSLRSALFTLTPGMTSCGSLAGHWRTTAPSPACGLIDCFDGQTHARASTVARAQTGPRAIEGGRRSEESKAVDEAASVVEPVNNVGRNKTRRRSKKQRLPKNLARRIWRRAWSRASPSQS